MDRRDVLRQNPTRNRVERALRDPGHFRIAPNQPLSRPPNAGDASVPFSHDPVVTDDYWLVNAARCDNRMVQSPRWWIFPNLFLHALLRECLGTKEGFVPVSGIVRV